MVVTLAGVSYQYGWLGPLSGTESSSSTTTTETTFTRQVTFTANSTEVQLLNVYAYFSKINPAAAIYNFNGSQWDYTLAVFVVWKNISPSTIYFFSACGNENIGGSLLPTTTAQVKLVDYYACTRPGKVVALSPGNQATSVFPAAFGEGTVYVTRGDGRVDMSLTLFWYTDPHLRFDTERSLNFTASFDI